MKKIISAVVALTIIGLLGYLTAVSGAPDRTIKKGDFVTVCKAGEGCGKFGTVAKDPKDCKCGAETELLHVLKVAGEVAVLCQCGGHCACELNAKNPYLCGCGSPVLVARIVK